MPADIMQLRSVDDIDRLLLESEARPVLLLKHSYSCGTSAQALDELLAHVDQRDSDDVGFAMVTVQTHRSVSNAIASRLGIRHETPQALLIRNGKVVWQASHFRVTADAIAAALSSQSAPSV